MEKTIEELRREAEELYKEYNSAPTEEKAKL